MLGQIDRLANAKGIPVEHLYAASIRHGNDGDPVIGALQPVLPTQGGSQPKAIIRGPMPAEARLTLSPRDR